MVKSHRPLALVKTILTAVKMFLGVDPFPTKIPCFDLGRSGFSPKCSFKETHHEIQIELDRQSDERELQLCSVTCDWLTVVHSEDL